MPFLQNVFFTFFVQQFVCSKINKRNDILLKFIERKPSGYPKNWKTWWKKHEIQKKFESGQELVRWAVKITRIFAFSNIACNDKLKMKRPALQSYSADSVPRFSKLILQQLTLLPYFQNLWYHDPCYSKSIGRGPQQLPAHQPDFQAASTKMFQRHASYKRTVIYFCLSNIFMK